MRICIDARAMSERPTGAGKALKYLLERLRKDFPRHEYVTCEPAGAMSWRLSRQLLWEQVELPLRALRLGADVLHVASGTPGPFVTTTKTVMTVHDLAPTRHPELLPHARSRWYWGRMVPRMARRAHAVLVPSAATKRDVVALAGVPEARVHVAPFGVPLELTGGATADEVRQTHGLPARYLLYVGTIDRRKDYRTLLGALAQLAPEIALVVAGTVIAGRTDFPETVARLGVERRVRMLGYVPERDLPGLYGGAAVFVYPSFYEGFGFPVLEAMACGTPVVCADATSLPEVVGDAGLLVHPGDIDAMAAALLRILGEPDLRASLAERALQRAAQFSWRTAAQQTLEVYRRVRAASPPPG
jgi:glycosyltransferase involved in cell wall biosynthesis